LPEDKEVFYPHEHDFVIPFHASFIAQSSEKGTNISYLSELFPFWEEQSGGAGPLFWRCSARLRQVM
jgi:hypothetical protein